jgi:hypothetical protein
MKDRPRSPSRREFVSTSLAATAGAGVAAALVTARPAHAARGARFELDSGSFPECPVTVAVTLPAAREGVSGHAWLHVRTPREHVVEDLGEVRFHRGEARVETRLVYPYERRVPGQYSYHVEVACGAERVVTETPATYSLRQFHWFC